MSDDMENVDITQDDAIDKAIAITDADSNVDADSEFTEVEQEAMRHGWKPQEHFKSDDSKKWRDADTFMEIHRKAEEIKDLKRLNKKLNSVMDNLGGFMETIRKGERDKTIKELQGYRKEAIELGDAELVDKFDVQIKEVEAMPIKPDLQKPTAQQYDDEAMAFIERNKSWFNEDTPMNEVMKGYACQRDYEIRIKNPNISPEELYQQVEDDVKNKFSQLNQPKGRATMTNKVALSSNRTGVPSKGTRLSRDMLSRSEQDVMDQMIKSTTRFNTKTKKMEPIISEQQYLEELAKSGLIKTK